MTVERRVALLRGVNVGGITVKSAPLAEVFRELGYSDVKTVLASGNVVFSAEGTSASIKKSIERALADAFGYDAWIILTDQPTLRSIAEKYPFDETAEKQPYVLFASEPSSLEALQEFAAAGLDPELERVEPGDGVLYWEVTRGHSVASAFSKESSKTRYRQTTTTRNLRTVRKLLEG